MVIVKCALSAKAAFGTVLGVVLLLVFAEVFHSSDICVVNVS